MEERRKIVAVVGGTGGTGEEIAAARAFAYELGRAVTMHGLVLLTGGRHTETGESVKLSAVQGARSPEGTVSRVIGVLKKRSEPVVECATSEGRHRYLYVHTGLGNARNYVNGVLPDALVALRGGAGTLSEVASGLHAGRRVLFFNSKEYLKTKLARDEEYLKFESHLREIAAEFPEEFPRGIEAGRWRERLVAELESGDDLTSTGAVLEAIEGVPVYGPVEFPDVKRLPGVREEFAKCLAGLLV